MKRIDSYGATSGNMWTEGSAVSGIPATVLSADYMNILQEEIAGVIEDAGLSLDQANDYPANNTGQLKSAMDTMYVNVSGDSMTGALSMGGNNINNVGFITLSSDPVASGQAARKSYVDNKFSSASPYSSIVGSSAPATHSTIADAITASSAGGCILVLPGTYVENISLSKNLAIYGVGYGTKITGSITLASGANYSHIRGMRFSGAITINAGVTGCFLHECWQAAGQAITDNGTGTSFIVYQE